MTSLKMQLYESLEAKEIDSDSEGEDVDLNSKNDDLQSDAFVSCIVPLPETQRKVSNWCWMHYNAQVESPNQ